MTTLAEPALCDLGELAAALAKAQAAFPAIGKDREVEVETRTGGRYSFRYAPLDTILSAVRAPLADNELALIQTLDADTSGMPVLRTEILHSGGGRVGGAFPLPLRADMTAQQIGSVITYVRRYAIVAILGVATEDDDDANHGSGGATRAPQNERAAGPERKISEAQVRRLWAIARDENVEEEQVRSILVEHAGVESTSDIALGDYDNVIAHIQAAGVPFP